jgi:DUF2075 family protein
MALTWTDTTPKYSERSVDTDGSVLTVEGLDDAWVWVIYGPDREFKVSGGPVVSKTEAKTDAELALMTARGE